ncbi:MAG: hypothetical protein RRZ42_03790 [Oscillospiraceae bacterium]
MQKYYDYFLGAASPSGFADFFKQLCDNNSPLRTYIIKSGPGCGKSTMMRRIGARIIKSGYSIEFIHCSSDPDSLEGIICRELNFAIADGTAPHILEPSLPAAKQDVISLYDSIDKQALICNLENLRDLFVSNAGFHERSARFISAAGSLFFDAERGAVRCILRDKLIRYVLSLEKKLLPPLNTQKGIEALRFSSAVTPKGIVNYAHDNAINNDRIYVLDDKFGAAGHFLLEHLLTFALNSGYDVTVSRSPLSPYEKIDMLEIPDLSLCLVLSSYIIPVEIECAKKINMLRFYSKDMLGSNKNRMAFSRKAALQLLAQASLLMNEAKSVHDKIEAIYKVNIDFGTVRKREQAVLDELHLL